MGQHKIREARTFNPSRESPTPDMVDISTLLSISKAEAMERFGWDDKTYEKIMKESQIEKAMAARENREGQKGVDIPMKIHLGYTESGEARLDEGFEGIEQIMPVRNRSGLLVARRANPIDLIRL